MVTTTSNKSFDWAKFNNLIWRDAILQSVGFIETTNVGGISA